MKIIPTELSIEQDLVRVLTPEEAQTVAGAGGTAGVICFTIGLLTNICQLVTQGCGGTTDCATTGCGPGGGTTTCSGETSSCYDTSYCSDQ
ncbi:hypothetical protein ACG02S_25790 [Roseateles sp. DC23W]|uniref:Bacteriocin-type signal sequence-containing protein n=1 Tax=Pelomonas dachongensis TaxID=3299029 RepID=A0ABW7EV16_9BURK